MALSLTATVTPKLTPALKTRYLAQLKAYASLKEQRDAIDQHMKATRTHVEEILSESDSESLEVDGYRSTLVAPLRTALDPQRLIMLGVDPAIIKEATVTTPGTPYLRITVPGSRDE
jgi:hypothetical protein